MYQPKVKNTQKYEDSQSSHIVTSGKLVLIPDNNSKILSFSHCSNTEEYYNKVKPILISETEEIKEGDWVYGKRDFKSSKELFQISGRDEMSQKHKFNKVLALPEHFSNKHLQAIVDSKMKEGEVLVKCWAFGMYHEVYLDNQNHITLFPAKQSLEEAAEEYAENKAKNINFRNTEREYIAEDGFIAGAEWSVKNNNY